MSRRLLLAVSPGEIWAALAIDGDAAALRLARTHGGVRAGDLHLGRVVALRPELPAALVDIGEDRPGFLPLDAMPQDSRPREGEAVVVTVARAARADKAAGLTPALEAEDRAVAVPPGAVPPLLLRRRRGALAALLDELAAPPPDEIVLDDAAAFAEARGWLQRHGFAGELTLHGGEAPLFEAAGIAAAVEAALAPRVALATGGALIIETAAAATLIDVDGGRAGALAANLAAAAEIARQLRLRDLSGPIVIDFIGMKGRGERERVAAALGGALTAADEAQLLGWTRLGHVELVRRRRRPSLAEQLYEHRPGGAPLRSALTVALDALRQIQRESRGAPGARFALVVHPEVAAALEREAAEPRRALEARLGYRLKVSAGSRPRDSVGLEPL